MILLHFFLLIWKKETTRIQTVISQIWQYILQPGGVAEGGTLLPLCFQECTSTVRTSIVNLDHAGTSDQRMPYMVPSDQCCCRHRSKGKHSSLLSLGTALFST